MATDNDGNEFVLMGLAPYRRNDGCWTVLTEWRVRCLRCGAAFIAEASGDRFPPVRCEGHRRRQVNRSPRKPPAQPMRPPSPPSPAFMERWTSNDLEVAIATAASLRAERGHLLDLVLMPLLANARSALAQLRPPQPLPGPFVEFRPPPQRDYSAHSTSCLSRLADGDARSDPYELFLIDHELSFRRRKNALELRKTIAARAEELKSLFQWPRIDPQPGIGKIEIIEAPSIGMLSYLGYGVGSRDPGERRRRAILDDIFTSELPRLNSHEYWASFGEPRSARRLKKMAQCISSFASNIGRRELPTTDAIEAWTSDLAYLKRTYFDGQFAWPTRTDVAAAGTRPEPRD